MKKLFLCLLILCSVLNVVGHEFIIKRVSMQPSDLSAIKNPYFDLNGDTCALIKIQTKNLEGIQFSNPNQYIKCLYTDGIYYVYMPSLGRKLDLIHKDYMPLQLDMANYGYNRLKKGKTYLVVLEAPLVSELKSSVILKVEPNYANVIFNEINYAANSTGTFEFPVTEGIHSYMVMAENYLSQNATISVKKSEVKTISIRLQPIMHEVLIGSNVDNARVFVDNIDYGSIGKLKIPQGNHIIRVQAKGYTDSVQNIYVSQTTSSLSFVLKENKKVTHIHAVPVTINAPETPCIFINNKKIKEWKNGVPIMLMPGTYSVTAFERSRERIIVVGNEPITINL